MAKEGRTVISKSAKRKVGDNKPNKMTEMVVYKTKLSNGKFRSETKHEPILR